MAYVEQTRDALANDKTVWEDISGGLDIINVGKFQMASRAYAGRFNFNGQDQQKKVGRSEEHTSELQSQSNLVCRLLLEKKKKKKGQTDDDENVLGRLEYG